VFSTNKLSIPVLFNLNSSPVPQIKTSYPAEAIHPNIHPSLYSRTKRLVDILGALVGLAITAVIAIPIAVAMQFDNPGPLLYSQIRCGYQGRHFRMWKFRSMVVNAEHLQHLVTNEVKGHIFKNENDPRVTRVGRFLRRTSLDELPQFWNVLMGDMSLVGTRPPTPGEVKDYQPHHLNRLNVKPGLTGEWQTHGRSSIKDFEYVIHLDLEYQRKWSIFYDLFLIVKTFQVLVNQKGAC
jgi:lipopolysaccharide/colanic/teichoic acid biosynthesis glycosyltransferase